MEGRTVLRYAIAVLALACAARQGSALDPNRRLSQYGHTAWRIQDGFLPNTPRYFAQTADGYLWVGTQSGSFRFDGVRLTPWRSPEGKQDAALSLFSSRDGSLWMGRARALTHIFTDSRSMDFDLPYVLGIAEDHDGGIWVTGRFASQRPGALCHIKGSAVQCFGSESGVPGQRLITPAVDPSGNVWFAGDLFLAQWNGKSARTYTTKGLQSNAGQDGIHNFAFTKDGTAWVAMTGPGEGLGLQRLVNGSFEPVRNAGFDGSRINAARVYVDRHDVVWVGTRGQGLFRIDGRQVDHFGKSDGLSSDGLLNFFEDREGSLWVATDDGFDCFRDLSVTRYSRAEGLASTEVDGVMALRDGSVLLSGYLSLDSIHDGKIKSLRWGEGLPGRLATSLLEDRAGRLWVGADDGLYTLSGGEFFPVRMPDGSKTGMIFGITEDRDQNVWAAATGGTRRLIRIQNGQVRDEFSTSQVPPARALAADPQGGIWLGLTDGDLARFENGKLQVVKIPRTTEGYASQISVDPEGSVLAASPSGLIGVVHGKPQILSSRNGLPCDAAMGFTPDRQGGFWIEMGCGVVRISKSELRQWQRDPETQVHPQVLDVFDGVRTGRAPFSPMVLSGDGRVWFANGLSAEVFDPAHLEANSAPPQVHIESLMADRKTYTLARGVRLPPRIHDLEIDYTALSLAAAQKVHFRYMLEGLYRDWQDAGNRRQAFYTDLRPGNYRFRVTACNNNGVWNETGDTLGLFIAPAYYQTNWFLALVAATVLVMLGAAYQFRMWQVQRESGRLRDVIETIPAFVWSAQPDGSVDFVNRRWLEFSGFSPGQALGWGWADALHPEDRPRLVDAFRGAMASGSPLEAEARMRGADGQYRWLLFRCVPQRDRSGKIMKWYGKSTDITELKRAEEERERLRQLEADLAHMNRVSMMGELAASIAHEVNQPISGVVSNGSACLRWLGRETADLEEAREAARRIVRDGKRAGEIIARIRALTKRAATVQEELDLNETIREVLALAADEAKKNSVTSRTQFESAVCSVYGDRVQMQQVLLNLVMNAIQAMSSVNGRERQLVITTRNADDDHVQVTVEDTGSGLDPEQITRIFEPFYTTRPGGMGMGLSISRSIVQAHGGRIWATANDGHGTSFHFALPKRHDEESHADTAAV